MSEQKLVEQKTEEKKKPGRPKIKYKCEVCGEEFDTKAGLYAHIGSKHANMIKSNNETKVEKLEIEKTERPKPKEEPKEEKKGFSLAGSLKGNIWLLAIMVVIVIVIILLRRRKQNGGNNGFESNTE